MGGLCCVSSQVRLECIHSVASAWLGRFQDFIMHNRGGVERWGTEVFQTKRLKYVLMVETHIGASTDN